MQLQIAPSLLSANFLELGKDVKMLNQSEADILHLDIMDGTFVPNISFGFPVVKSIAKLAKKPMDAHLMVVKPERWFETLASLGVSMVSFHQEESKRKTAANIKAIQDLGMKAGVVINPDIPVKNLFPYIGEVDYFLIMSVFAGFGGQKFIYESLDKIAILKKEVTARGAKALIEVDGGVGPGNIKALAEAGVDIAVAGSSIFSSEDPAETIKALKRA